MSRVRLQVKGDAIYATDSHETYLMVRCESYYSAVAYIHAVYGRSPMWDLREENIDTDTPTWTIESNEEV